MKKVQKQTKFIKTDDAVRVFLPSKSLSKDQNDINIDINLETHQNTQIRTRFDKDGHPMISKGILIRKDIDYKYDIRAAVLHVYKYQLINDALVYYYENILNKSKKEKLVEAGQSVLKI